MSAAGRMGLRVMLILFVQLDSTDPLRTDIDQSYARRVAALLCADRELLPNQAEDREF